MKGSLRACIDTKKYNFQLDREKAEDKYRRGKALRKSLVGQIGEVDRESDKNPTTKRGDNHLTRRGGGEGFNGTFPHLFFPTSSLSQVLVVSSQSTSKNVRSFCIICSTSTWYWNLINVVKIGDKIARSHYWWRWW